MGADLLSVVVGMSLAFLVSDLVGSGEPDGQASNYLVVGIGSLPLWLAAFYRTRLYSSRHVSSAIREFTALFDAVVISALLTGAFAFMIAVDVSRTWLVLSGVLVLLVMFTERLIARRIFWRLRANGYLLRPVYIVGWNDEARALCEALIHEPGLGYRVLGVMDDELSVGTVLDHDLSVVGRCDETLEEVRRSSATGAIVSTAVKAKVANEVARDLMEHGYFVELASSLQDIAAERLLARPLGRFSFMAVEPTHLNTWRAGAKRVFDVVGSLLFLLITLPLSAVAAIAIKLDSPGPVLFRQTRTGRDGREFQVLKFRTMVVNAEAVREELRHLNEADGPLFKIRNDPRITRVGRVLRRTSFDEVPQFWNVLRGEMSIVGPRPALPHEVHAWSPELHQRLRVKPGITGMWQVSGRSDATFEDYVRLDLYYVDNWSLLTDFLIVVKTLPTVMSRKGAH
jgi:exopolysaccharide biosynthesis polyprenyl glycosylphosphotransferase